MSDRYENIDQHILEIHIQKKSCTRSGPGLGALRPLRRHHRGEAALPLAGGAVASRRCR